MEEQKNNIWLWVAVIVLVVLVLAAVYYYGYTPKLQENTVGEKTSEEELASELNALDFGDLESELGDIEKELAQ